MQTLVDYPPTIPGEYTNMEYRVWGMIPIRAVVSKRVEGWCVYFLLKYMYYDYYIGYGDDPREPISFERVRFNGDKMPEKYAREIFPEMEGPYTV